MSCRAGGLRVREIFPPGQLRISIAPDMSFTPPRLAPLLFIVTIAAIGCGGSNSVQAKRPRPTQAKAEAEPDNEKTEAPDPKCTDGTCFVCGTGICIAGFYCDESSAQPNCQWLSKCGRTTTCACLTEIFGSNCTCAERSGGIYVKCST